MGERKRSAFLWECSAVADGNVSGVLFNPDKGQQMAVQPGQLSRFAQARLPSRPAYLLHIADQQARSRVPSPTSRGPRLHVLPHGNDWLCDSPCSRTRKMLGWSKIGRA